MLRLFKVVIDVAQYFYEKRKHYNIMSPHPVPGATHPVPGAGHRFEGKWGVALSWGCVRVEGGVPM